MSSASTSTGESTSGSSDSESGSSSPVPQLQHRTQQQQRVSKPSSSSASTDTDSSSDSSDSGDEEVNAGSNAAPTPSQMQDPSEDEADESAPKWTKPKGFSLIESNSQSSAFNFEQVERDPNLELWLFKIPEGVKAKHLAELAVPAQASTSKDALDTFHARKSNFELVEVTNDKKGSANGEMNNLQPLLPGQDLGRLQLSSKGLSRRFIVQHALIEPAPLAGAVEEEELPADAPYAPLKRPQPASLKRVRNQLGNWNTGDSSGGRSHTKKKRKTPAVSEDVDMADRAADEDETASSQKHKHKKRGDRKAPPPTEQEGAARQEDGDVSMETGDASKKKKKRKDKGNK